MTPSALDRHEQKMGSNDLHIGLFVCPCPIDGTSCIPRILVGETRYLTKVQRTAWATVKADSALEGSVQRALQCLKDYRDEVRSISGTGTKQPRALADIRELARSTEFEVCHLQAQSLSTRFETIVYWDADTEDLVAEVLPLTLSEAEESVALVEKYGKCICREKSSFWEGFEQAKPPSTGDLDQSVDALEKGIRTLRRSSIDVWYDSDSDSSSADTQEDDPQLSGSQHEGSKVDPGETNASQLKSASARRNSQARTIEEAMTAMSLSGDVSFVDDSQ